MQKIYGILGGMGPLAGASLLRRIIELTNVSIDQHHIPILLYSIPQIPDRSSAVMERGRSPVPEISFGLRALALGGACEVAIACNTAHYWYTELQDTGGIYIIHIVDAVMKMLSHSNFVGEKIGLLATEGTVRGAIYHKRLEAAGFQIEAPTQIEFEKLVSPAIRAVKAGDVELAKVLFLEAAQRQINRGAERIILGCTEVGIAIYDDKSTYYIDSNEALARYCVDRWHRPVDV